MPLSGAQYTQIMQYAPMELTLDYMRVQKHANNQNDFSYGTQAEMVSLCKPPNVLL